MAVAVRIARAVCLPLEISGKHGLFFDREMRRRLWHTICVVDLQTSFEQASEPLIALEMVNSVPLPKNINDSDFEPGSTVEDIPDQEGLSEMTFALVTYHAQLSGRLLNFVAADDEAGAAQGPHGTDGGVNYNWEARQQHVRKFVQESLKLLQFCDPESSPYAWFTLHGTQSLVETMRLSALRPLHRAGSGAPPRVQGSSHLLRVALSVLQKSQLIFTDARGDGFRWYVNVQWHALAIAATECYVCTDLSLLRQAWPLVEASYRQKVVAPTSPGPRQSMLQGPLEKLMRQTREKVASSMLSRSWTPTADGAQLSMSMSPAAYTIDAPDMSVPGAAGSGTSLSSHVPMIPTPAMSRPMTPSSIPVSPFTSLGSSGGGVQPQLMQCDPSQTYAAGIFADPDTFSDTSDAAWKTWEEFVLDLSLEGVGSTDFLGSIPEDNSFMSQMWMN